MKIQMRENVKTNFGNVNRGDVFYYGIEYYLKIDEVDNYNAICLNDGLLIWFEYGDEVELVDAVLEVR